MNLKLLNTVFAITLALGSFTSFAQLRGPNPQPDLMNPSSLDEILSNLKSEICNSKVKIYPLDKASYKLNDNLYNAQRAASSLKNSTRLKYYMTTDEATKVELEEKISIIEETSNAIMEYISLAITNPTQSRDKLCEELAGQ